MLYLAPRVVIWVPLFIDLHHAVNVYTKGDEIVELVSCLARTAGTIRDCLVGYVTYGALTALNDRAL
jgi:hypothetical protein